MPPAVAIVDDADLPAAAKLAAALQRIGLHHVSGRAVILPELSGFAARSPAATDPALVEALIDLLHDAGAAEVAVVGSPDSSALWAGNRDLYALADLLGYRFVTPRGRSYDIMDLAEDTISTAFPAASALAGHAVARAWLDADLRIVFSKNRTDEGAGYALCLDTLIGALPLTDKDLHYRRRRHPGDVVAALLDAAPPQLCLIDAIVSAHGAGGRRDPAAIDTGTIIAATHPLLADQAGALKMGLDPAVSPLFAHVQRTHELPARYEVSGPLTAYRGWRNVPPVSQQAAQQRGAVETLDRLLTPWLQRLDAELFPLLHPLDARMNAELSQYGQLAEWLVPLAGLLIGTCGHALEAYRVLFDKDALRQVAVPLGIDLEQATEERFHEVVAELDALAPLAYDAPSVSRELRWRMAGEAIVFRYARVLPIEHDLFVQRVDIARTIQFMNDYLGGVLVPLAFDATGRPIRQAERNLYLPQPNYLALYQGKPIDVSKLEVVDYQPDRHRLYWKTIHSENGSATYDDGVATFERTAEGTRVSIIGRQQFTLPPFFQVFDLDRVPDLKAHLVTHAYQTFFDRTLANFEALVEGRDIRIGRPVDEPAIPAAEQLMPLLEKAGELLLPLLQGATSSPTGDTQHVDADGFVHITPGRRPDVEADEAARWSAAVATVVQGFIEAAQRDLLQPVPKR